MSDEHEHDHDGITHDHDHPHGDHDHDHDGPEEQAYTPQPVPMAIRMDVVPLQNGEDRIRVEYSSLNGSWVVFFDREYAIKHAQSLLAAAYSPPVAPPATADEQPSGMSSEPPVVLEGETVSLETDPVSTLV